jgi:hypothetical protein
MECLVFNLDEFLACYPEFSCIDSVNIEAVAKQVLPQFSYFESYFEAQRVLAMYLAVAHFTYLRFDPRMSGGAVREVESRNDRIEYAVKPSDNPFDLHSTFYGQQLLDLRKGQLFLGFTTGAGAYSGGCGCDY